MLIYRGLFEELKQEEIIVVYRLLSKDAAAEVFTELDSDLQERLINILTDKELKEMLNELYLDDTVDLIEEMPANVVKRILKSINKEDRKTINELLKYPEDSAGSIMTTEFVDLKENMTVADAFDKIRKVGVDKETIYTCYVLTMKRKILGIVSLKDLLIADKEVLIKDIMDTNVITLATTDECEDVVKVFKKYDAIALPVVDKENRLVGIITVDDVVDVMHEETEADFERLAAVGHSDQTYFKTGVFTHTKNRIFWLLILMLSSAITGGIITKYEEAFAVLPILVSFIPMIMGTGGNCGSQTSTLIIRGLSIGEIELKDFVKTLWKEIRIALLVGIALFVVNGIRIYAQYKDIKLCLVLGITLALTIIVSKVLGCILPMLVKFLKQDPALMASPIITTIVDITSILIYFAVAVNILHI